jgi:hypothetical protein
VLCTIWSLMLYVGPFSKECEDENLLVVEKSDDWH